MNEIDWESKGITATAPDKPIKTTVNTGLIEGQLHIIRRAMRSIHLALDSIMEQGDASSRRSAHNVADDWVRAMKAVDAIDGELR